MPLLYTLLLGSILWLPGASVGGEIYRWVDKDGNVHFTENPPPSARARAWKREGAGRVTIMDAAHPSLLLPAPGPASPEPEEPKMIAGKHQWEWRKQARALEAKIESLEERLDSAKDSSLSGFPSTVASMRFDARKKKRIELIEASIEAAEDELGEYEDTARHAGVPRGWLR